MKKTIDYQNLYLKQYKNIPNIYFVATLVTLLLATVILFVIFALEEIFEIAIPVLLGGVAVAFGLAYLNRFIASVAISQKVVVADTLLSMKDGTSAPVDEDELPEL